jgi:hypothetical protein
MVTFFGEFQTRPPYVNRSIINGMVPGLKSIQ